VNIKKGETLDDLTQCLRVLEELGIRVSGFFIIGLPGDTILHTLRSFRFALAHANLCEAYFFNANPIAGTEFHAWAAEHRYLRTPKRSALENIGGMGEEILVETAEFPLRERQLMYRISKLVTLAVRYRFRTRHRLSRLRRMSQAGLGGVWRHLRGRRSQ
jgi:radical SAM superfamily enzyme YgiQ (UPF0313 family)